MSSIVVRVTQQGGAWFCGEATAHRFANSPELAARLAAAAALGCEVSEVQLTGQARDLWLARRAEPKPAVRCVTCEQFIPAGKLTFPTADGFECEACWACGQGGAL